MPEFNVLFARKINKIHEFCMKSGTRGHAYKLFKPRCTASIRSNFFAERVINIWNSLPVSVNFSTLKSFHRTIQSVDFSSFLKCS